MRGNIWQMAQVTVLQPLCPQTSLMPTLAPLTTCHSILLWPVYMTPVQVSCMLKLAPHGPAISQIPLASSVSNTGMLSATSFVMFSSFTPSQQQCQQCWRTSGSLECSRHLCSISSMRLHSSKKQMPQPLQHHHHPLDHSKHALVLFNILPMQLTAAEVLGLCCRGTQPGPAPHTRYDISLAEGRLPAGEGSNIPSSILSG